MGFGRSISALVFFTACNGGGADDTGSVGFSVAESAPEHRDVDVTAAQSPEFRLNASADSDNCSEDNFLLVAIDEGGAFAFDVDYVAVLQDGGNKLQFTHSEPFLQGYWYAAMVLNTESPCLSDAGLPLEPFGIEFYVP
jgi:hypothetical protein